MADPAATGGAAQHQAERKLVTVLLAEVDEAVTTWTELDPEDVERSVAADVARVQAEVERFGGVIEQRVGGRALAVFGLPRTHDDDPERAVRAALAIRQAVGLARAGARTRVAVATGRALVRLGPRGAAGQRVLGDPITTCARLLEVAPPGAILVAESTVRASERAVAYGPAGMVALRSGEPAAVWTPLGPEGAPAPGLLGRGSPPLVARGGELGALLDEVAQVVATGSPRLVAVLGEPGIGKSRLLAELATTVETGARPLAWRQGRSPPYGAMAFLPLAQVVRAEAAILETDTAEQAERKLRRTVNAVLSEQRDPEAVGWMTGQLLRLVGGAVQVGATRPLEDGDSSEEMLGVWRRFLYALAGKRPLVLAVEDAQWADPALLDFLESLADPQLAPAAGSAPLLVIVTARPELAERRPRLGGRQRSAGTTIRLEPLSDADTAALLAALLDHHGLAPEVGPELLARAGGNPLFAEEYVRMVRDRGASLRAPGGGTLPVPETVHGIVATRLDALPAAETPPTCTPASCAWKPGSCSSSISGRRRPATPGTPSGTWSCATSRTTRSCEPSAWTSIWRRPSGWSGSARTGPASAPTCSPTTTGPRSSCRTPSASRSRAWRSWREPHCGTPATAPQSWGCTRARPAPTPTRSSCARPTTRSAPSCCCGSAARAAAARAPARRRCWPRATPSAPAASGNPPPRPSCCSASWPSWAVVVASGRPTWSGRAGWSPARPPRRSRPRSPGGAWRTWPWPTATPRRARPPPRSWPWRASWDCPSWRPTRSAPSGWRGWTRATPAASPTWRPPSRPSSGRARRGSPGISTSPTLWRPSATWPGASRHGRRRRAWPSGSGPCGRCARSSSSGSRSTSGRDGGTRPSAWSTRWSPRQAVRGTTWSGSAGCGGDGSGWPGVTSTGRWPIRPRPWSWRDEPRTPWRSTRPAPSAPAPCSPWAGREWPGP